MSRLGTRRWPGRLISAGAEACGRWSIKYITLEYSTLRAPVRRSAATSTSAQSAPTRRSAWLLAPLPAEPNTYGTLKNDVSQPTKPSSRRKL